MSKDTNTKSPFYPFASAGWGSLKTVVMGARDLARLRVVSESGSGVHDGGD